jgi:hypothetical protein
MRRPEAGHTCFCEGGVDHIGGARLHAEPASLAEGEEIIFRQGSGGSDQSRV